MPLPMPKESPVAPLAWPRGRHYLLLALAYSGIAVYGSLVPLEYHQTDWSAALNRFREIPYLPLGVASRADWVANILLFVPLSYLWMAVLRVDRPGRWLSGVAAIALALCCAALSVGLEFTQIWFPPRTVSRNDILAETLGGVLGAVLWLLWGQGITSWVRHYTSTGRRPDQIDWLLQAYCAGLLLYSVMPLDLTLNPADLAAKFRDGKINVVPLVDLRLDLGTLYRVISDIAVFVPVGVLATRIFTSKPGQLRGISMAVLLSSGLVFSIEISQLVVYSRFTSVTDLLSGSLGATLGAWLMHRWSGDHWESAGPSERGRSRMALCWAALAALYCLLLLAVFCMPLDPIEDGKLIRARFHGFFRVPFAALYRGSEFNALTEVLKKLLFFAPLGALLSMVAAALAPQGGTRRLVWLGLGVLIAVGMGTGIEMVQVFLPPHVPDVTDVLLYSSGAVLGMWLVQRLLKST